MGESMVDLNYVLDIEQNPKNPIEPNPSYLWTKDIENLLYSLQITPTGKKNETNSF